MKDTAMSHAEKLGLLRGALLEVLGNHDATKVGDYFTDDAVIIINEKRLEGKQQISDRLNWIRANTGNISVTIHRAFFHENQGFDHHTTEAVTADGEPVTFKIFGYCELRDGKICLYEDVTIQTAGKEAMHVATSSRI
ncbi:hypothetical protein GZ77_01785 [Endozoicomonas montiporae]|uniref:SnoaL-like domain-containing protein n=2 Tax=Endozoicomonas montiporae TaxID=1027273 RepID=A0A081NAD1_9GAMM|nr:nuclear transport factor 2 family protein [Endozoicomonas montiporae]AMO56917.1 hypothetical protein EZMO1_2872 [Endozoicomonas montiporae CL-33]KEQ15404.1 hypothetical protein GZ77_01785 [Endozoicomonas montiporae]